MIALKFLSFKPTGVHTLGCTKNCSLQFVAPTSVRRSHTLENLHPGKIIPLLKGMGSVRQLVSRNRFYKRTHYLDSVIHCRSIHFSE